MEPDLFANNARPCSVMASIVALPVWLIVA
jgi:hypothetical protein